MTWTRHAICLFTSLVILAVALSNPSAVRSEVIYHTDFPEPDGSVPSEWQDPWEVLAGDIGPPSGWHININGELRYGVEGGVTASVVYKGVEVPASDYSAASDFRKSISDEHFLGVNVRQQSADTYYTARLDKADNFALVVYQNGAGTVLDPDTSTTIPFVEGQTWRIAVDAYGDAIRGRLFDNRGRLVADKSAIDSSIASGQAGLRARGVSAFETFDIKGSVPELRAYDGFTTNVDGSDGGYLADASVVNAGPPRQGFSGNWTSGDAFSSNVNFNARSAGLTYGALQTQSGAMELFRTAGSSSEDKTIERSLSPGFQPEDEIWGSFLFSHDGFTEDSKAGVRFLSGTSQPISGGGFLVFEVFGDGTGAFRTLGDEATSLDLGPISSGETHMALFRVNATMDGPNGTDLDNIDYDEISIWLDPDLGNLGTPDASGFGIVRRPEDAGFDPFGRFELTGNPTVGYSFMLDELRLGTGFAAVAPVPVPEPSSYALGLLAAAAVGLLVRRRPVAPASAARAYCCRGFAD